MPSLLEQVRFEDVSPMNLKDLKLLNSIIFPIVYQDKMYEQCLMCGPVSQLAYLGDKLIGAIACRLESKPKGRARLYIMTLGVLASYRSDGLGSELLRRSLEMCSDDDCIDEASLHVQTNNEDAVRFYSRFGFEVAETIKNYYPRLDPPDAFLLARKLNQGHLAPYIVNGHEEAEDS